MHIQVFDKFIYIYKDAKYILAFSEDEYLFYNCIAGTSLHSTNASWSVIQMAHGLQFAKKNKKTGIDRLAEHVVTLGSWNMGVRIVNTRRISAGWKHLRFWLKHNPIDSRAKCLKLQRWSKSW